MLKNHPSPDYHLRHKMKHIVITNVCNLTCGGCHQHCGNFDKPQLWFIGLDDFQRHIEILKLPENRLYLPNSHYITKISIFGGEPTVHPQWSDLVDIMHSHQDVLFRVSTNGRLHKNPKNPYPKLTLNVATLKSIIRVEKSNLKLEDNVLYVIDPKDESKVENYQFVPTLVAPIDLYPHKSKSYFWIKAQQDCGIWKHCSAAIYNNKAYFCEVAASMDHLLFNGENGWDVTDKPFSKTTNEIAEQAEKFCYRCAWCVKGDDAIKQHMQKISEPTKISQTNVNSLPNPKGKFLEIVQIDKIDRPDISVVTNTWKRHKDLIRCIEFVKKQKGNIEHIVVSDGPDDEVKEICKQYKVRCKCIKRNNDQGRSNGHYAKDVGIDMAKGRYICLWDDDNYYYDDAIENLYLCANGYDIGVCGAMYYKKHRSEEYPNIFFQLPQNWEGKFVVGDIDTMNVCISSKLAKLVKWADSKVYEGDFIWLDKICSQFDVRINYSSTVVGVKL
jgi:organic radical activating enzyme